MSKLAKLLERMRNNPNGDWSIDDLRRICRSVPGIEVNAPTRGSHYTISHPALQEILTVPAHKPLKGVYVKRFLSIMDSIIEEGGEDRGSGNLPETE